MKQCNHGWIMMAIALVLLASVGCSAPEKYREFIAGMTPEEVLALLGEPDSKTRSKKHTLTDDYFGPKPSKAYRDFPDGATIEIWSYGYFRETWTYVFSLAEQPPQVVETGYHHPDIVY